MEWFDVAEMGDADGVRPSGEAADGGGVGLAGVRVPDVGGEELEDALGGGRSRLFARRCSIFRGYATVFL